jgi:hypothetical protein
MRDLSAGNAIAGRWATIYGYDRIPETPAEDIRNALQILVGCQPFTTSPQDVSDSLVAIEQRLRTAIGKLEGATVGA